VYFIINIDKLRFYYYVINPLSFKEITFLSKLSCISLVINLGKINPPPPVYVDKSESIVINEGFGLNLLIKNELRFVFAVTLPSNNMLIDVQYGIFGVADIIPYT
jgi:hypothetical protein